MNTSIFNERQNFVNEFSVSGDSLLHHVAKHAVLKNKHQQFFKMLEDQSKSGTEKLFTYDQHQKFLSLLGRPLI